MRQQRVRLCGSLYQLLRHLHQLGVRRQQLRHLRNGMCELEHVPERKLHVMSSALPLDDAISRRRAQIAGAQHRRRKLAKYVIGVVSGSLALCLAAAAKIAFVDHRPAAALAPPPSEAIARPAEPEPAASSASAPAEPAGAPTVSVVTADAPAASVQPAAADHAAKGQTSPTQDAVRLREASRAALERGSLKSSIEAGESSVAIDPSDSEAWLVLGAAYQQMGSLEQARRCFRSCLEKGKGGSRGECAAMLR